ncbi:uncharacterized protein LOC128273014 [Anopheles cruzii]|uniref:uncharacterized protein LOC128273014 n=1 Tax=Anopheles cruzii TaxID=68878 RepID=UPI0022EC700F|nr:uncharacterized protein LOC128273014 [Anopheles cruzii]
MSLQGEDALVAFESFSFLVKCLGVNPPISCERKRTRCGHQCLNVLSILLSTAFYSYLLASSLDSQQLRVNWKSLIIARLHDLYFILRYLTVIVVQLHVLRTGGETNRMFRALNNISNAISLLANRKGFTCTLHYFGTISFAKSLRIFAVAYPLVCLMLSSILIDTLEMKPFGGSHFQFVRILYFETYVQLWLQATLALLLVHSRYEALKELFG